MPLCARVNYCGAVAVLPRGNGKIEFFHLVTLPRGKIRQPVGLKDVFFKRAFFEWKMEDAHTNA